MEKTISAVLALFLAFLLTPATFASFGDSAALEKESNDTTSQAQS